MARPSRSFISLLRRQHVDGSGVQAVLLAAGAHRRVPAHLGPGPQLTLQPAEWRRVFIFPIGSQLLWKCLTVISPQAALHKTLMTTSIVTDAQRSSQNVLFKSCASASDFPVWLMRSGRNYAGNERLLFGDSFVWRASVQLVLACGPGWPLLFGFEPGLQRLEQIGEIAIRVAADVCPSLFTIATFDLSLTFDC